MPPTFHVPVIATSLVKPAYETELRQTRSMSCFKFFFVKRKLKKGNLDVMRRK